MYLNILKDQTPVKCFLRNNSQEDYIQFFKLAKNIGLNIRLLSANRISLEDIFLDVINKNGGPK